MSALERHLSINEIAELWGLSPGVVRALFKDRGDVIRIGSGETRFRRGYLTLRVPESVVERVHAELRSR
jgi:hypothetical protein